MTTETYEVKGMTCEHCVRAVSTEIGEIDGVDDVTVDLHSGRVEVTSSRNLDPSVVKAAVEEAGYELAG